MTTTQSLRRMYAISEGPCFGLVDGLKSIHLNGTPILAEDGTTFNFKNICVALVNGTKTQQSIKGFPDIETEFSVGSEITYSMPQYITVSDTSVNAVIVSITLPSLQGIDPTTGKQIRKTVQLSIDVQASGGSYVPQTIFWEGKISDCASGSVAQSYEIPLDGTGPWTLRIKRLTADATDSYTQDKTYLGSYTQIKHAKLTNPWTAKMAISLNAEQFSSAPDVTLDYKGRIVKVPSNYDPATRDCPGIWDGTFKDAWSDNPAWCFFDMAMSARYGSGRYLDESGIDIWRLYEIAQYCDEPVSSGQTDNSGNIIYEPRCTFNGYLSTDEECFKVLAHIISVARAQLYYGASQDQPSTMLTAVQDAPGTVAALFSPSNVIGGKFTYSGTPRKTRYTEVTVWWNDPEQNYKLVPVLVVADASHIARYGVQSYETTAFGCTSKGQAVREGRRILYTNLLETGLLSFESGLEGMVICPGQLIQVKDPARDRERKGGRLKDGCTTTTLALDGDVTLASGMAYTAYVTLPSGKVESRGITTAAGTVSSVTLASALSSTPQAESQWQIVPTATAPTVWRVLGVKEKKSESSISYEISAVQNAPEKYALIETIGTIPSTPEDPPVVFAPVTGLMVTANTAWAAGNSVITVQAAWTMPKDATGARAMIRIDTGAWQEMTVSGSSATFAADTARPVEIQVFAEYKRGTSVAATASYTIPAITTTTPSSLTLTVVDDKPKTSDADIGTPNARLGDDPVVIFARHVRAAWVHSDANEFALKGFRCVFYNGSDPNDSSTYMRNPLEVGPSRRSATIDLYADSETSLAVAVQAIYLDGNESAWRLASGAVVSDPDTLAIATKSAVQTAQATATSAATVAATATSGLSILNSDDTLSCAKKPQTITDYNAEITTRAQLQAAAGACSPAVDHSVYTAAVDTLASFLGALTPAWTDLGQDTPLGSGGGATMRSRWATIAQQRTALQVSISSAQAAKAQNDAISAAAQDAAGKVSAALVTAANDATTKAAAQKQSAIDAINASVGGMVPGATSAADAVGKIQTAAAAAQGAADGIRVGGRNLLLDSARARTSPTEYVGTNITAIAQAHLGEQVSISLDLRASIAGEVRVYGLGGYTFDTMKTVQATTSWQRVVLPVGVFGHHSGDPNGDYCILSVYGTYGTGVIPEVRNIKVELGNRATDWTPAPEDVDASIQAAHDAANAAQTMPTYASPSALPAASSFAPGYGPVLTISDYSLWRVNAGATAWDRILFGAEGIFGKVTADQIDVTDTLRAAVATIAYLKSTLINVIADATATGPGGTTQIGGNGIRTKSIYASNLVISPQGDCINPDPSFQDASLWAKDANVQISTGASAVSGSIGLGFADVVSGTDQRVQSATRFPISSNRTYSLTANLYRAATSDRNMYVFVNFYDASGNQISTSWGGFMSGYTFGGIPPGGVWSRQGGQFGAGTGHPIPSNAVACSIGVWMQYSDNGSNSNEQSAQDLRLELVTDASLLVDGAVKARHLEALLAITSVIQSPNWVAGAYGAAPQGFKLSGYAFTTTYKDGSTSSNCYQELGGDANFGGVKVGDVVANVFGRVAQYASAGSYSWTCPAGVTQVEVTVTGAGGGGGGGVAASHGGGGGGAGLVCRKLAAVTPGTTYTVVVGAPGSGAQPGGTPGAGGESSAAGVSAAGGYGAYYTGAGGQSGGLTAGGAIATAGSASSTTCGIVTIASNKGGGGGGGTTTLNVYGGDGGGSGESGGSSGSKGSTIYGAGGGGSSVWGVGGNGGATTGSAPSATAYGAGGGGGAATASAGYAGAAGACGNVVIRF